MKTKKLFLSAILMVLTFMTAVGQGRGTCTGATTSTNCFYYVNNTRFDDVTTGLTKSISVGAYDAVQIGNVFVQSSSNVYSGKFLDNSPVTFTIAMSSTNGSSTSFTNVTWAGGIYGSKWMPTVPASYFTPFSTVTVAMTVTNTAAITNVTPASNCPINATGYTYTYTFNVGACVSPQKYAYYGINNANWVDPAPNDLNAVSPYRVNAGTSSIVNVNVPLGSTFNPGLKSASGAITYSWTVPAQTGATVVSTAVQPTINPSLCTIGQTLDVIGVSTDLCGAATTFTFHLTGVAASPNPTFYRKRNPVNADTTTDPAPAVSGVIDLSLPGGWTFKPGIKNLLANAVYTSPAQGANPAINVTANEPILTPFVCADPIGTTRDITATYSDGCTSGLIYTFRVTKSTNDVRYNPILPNTFTAYAPIPSGGIIDITLPIGGTFKPSINRTTATYPTYTSTGGNAIPGFTTLTNSNEPTINPKLCTTGQVREVIGTFTDGCSVVQAYTFRITAGADHGAYYNNGAWIDPATVTAGVVNLNIPGGTIFRPGIRAIGTQAIVGNPTYTTDEVGFTPITAYEPAITPNLCAIGSTRTVTGTANYTDATSGCVGTLTKTITFILTATTSNPSVAKPYYNNRITGWTDPAVVTNVSPTVNTVTMGLSPNSANAIDVGMYLNGGTVTWVGDGISTMNGTTPGNGKVQTSFDPHFTPCISGETRTVTATYVPTCGGPAITYNYVVVSAPDTGVYTHGYFNNFFNSGWVDPAGGGTTTISLNAYVGFKPRLGINVINGYTYTWASSTGGTFTYSGNGAAKHNEIDFSANVAAGGSSVVTCSVFDGCTTTTVYTFTVFVLPCIDPTPIPFYNNGLGSGWVDGLTTQHAFYNIPVGSGGITVGINPSAASWKWKSNVSGLSGTTGRQVSFNPGFNGTITSPGTVYVNGVLTSLCGIKNSYTWFLSPSETKLRPKSCNKTLARIVTAVEASPLQNATQYTFEITRPDTSVEEFVSPRYWFQLHKTAAGVLYNSTYTIRVKSKVYNAYQNYGPACTVTTPAAPLARTAKDDASVFEATAFPNPFATNFTLDIQSSSDAVVELKVFDMIGRTLEVKKASVSELTSLQIGHNYPAGIYNLVVKQGQNVKSIRMIKK